MMKLKSFLCCGLSTAGLVFGYLGIVGALISLVIVSLLLYRLDDILMYIQAELSGMGDHSAENVELARPYIEIVLGVCILIACIEGIVSLCLIIGTIKKNHYLIIPYLTKHAIALVVGVIYLAFVFVAACVSGMDIGPIILYLIMVGAGLVFNTFVWIAIYSLFSRIKESSHKEAYLLPNEEGSLYTNPPEKIPI